jgi:PAS domain S-box-containing protein
MNHKDAAKILIVDDQIHALQGVSRIMRGAGYEVLEASNGTDCLRLAREHKPDLILLNVVLPDIDGMEACKRIKSDSETADIYVVLLSSIKTESDGQAEGLEIGADGYIAKPIPNRKLLARVKSLLRLKYAEDRLGVNEERFRGMFENHKATMLLIETVTGKILDANKAAERFYGYTKSRLLSMSIQDINVLPPEEVEAQRNLALKEERNYFIFPHRLANGEVRTVEVYSAPIEENGSNVLFSIIHDITDRKRLEDALRQAQVFASALLENILDGVVACDADGTLALFNRTAREWHGLDPMAIPQQEWADHYDLYCEDGVTPMTVATVPLARAFRGEEVRNTEMVIQAKGQPERHILANAAPFFDENGAKLGAVAVMHDITERKCLEKEKESLIIDLQKALSEVKKLSGFLPICASCKKIRDDKGYWSEVEKYIGEHSEAQFSHGICPDCMRKLYPEVADEVLNRLEKDEKK